MSIAESIEHVRQKIRKAARSAGRDPDAVEIVAVTKTVGSETAREAADSGIRILGENRVQEAKEKIQKIGSSVQWHMIGHLQTNKARQAVALFDVIHSVDSLRLAQALDREAARQGKQLSVLVQVNIVGEAGKFGVNSQDALNLIRAVSSMQNLTLKGLMTIPPYFTDPEECRPIFRSLRDLKDRALALGLCRTGMEHLSMGMTHDYEIAVQEGATMVRIGTAIFGERV